MTACGAKTRSGAPCRKPPIRGGARCRMHGGASPQAMAAAAQRATEQRARRALEALGETTPVTDPFAALEDLAGQAVALVDLLRVEASRLEQIRYSAAGMGTEQIRGELQAYLAAMARAESILGRIVSLDLDARRLRLDEAKAAVVIAALAKVLAHRDLALDEERQRRARALLAAELVPARSNGVEVLEAAAVVAP